MLNVSDLPNNNLLKNKYCESIWNDVQYGMNISEINQDLKHFLRD